MIPELKMAQSERNTDRVDSDGPERKKYRQSWFGWPRAKEIQTELIYKEGFKIALMEKEYGYTSTNCEAGLKKPRLKETQSDSEVEETQSEWLWLEEYWIREVFPYMVYLEVILTKLSEWLERRQKLERFSRWCLRAFEWVSVFVAYLFMYNAL
jgi:hypothetical protein